MRFVNSALQCVRNSVNNVLLFLVQFKVVVIGSFCDTETRFTVMRFIRHENELMCINKMKRAVKDKNLVTVCEVHWLNKVQYFVVDDFACSY